MLCLTFIFNSKGFDSECLCLSDRRDWLSMQSRVGIKHCGTQLGLRDFETLLMCCFNFLFIPRQVGDWLILALCQCCLARELVGGWVYICEKENEYVLSYILQMKWEKRDSSTWFLAWALCKDGEKLFCCNTKKKKNLIKFISWLLGFSKQKGEAEGVGWKWLKDCTRGPWVKYYFFHELVL